MISYVDVAIIGGGIFGVETALSAASLGLKVKVFEANDTIMSGATKNNQNRLHLGFHYPRDIETGRQSIRGFYAFKHKYQDCITGQFDNAYFIASKGSLTRPEEYLKFCRELGVNYKEINPSDFHIDLNGVDIGILCEEVVYDVALLKSTLLQSLEKSQINLALNTRISEVQHSQDGFEIFDHNGNKVKAKFLINATYSDINRITAALNYNILQNHYEYTVVPVVELDIPRVGITIMDGPFYTLLPFGKTSKYLLYSVEQSVISTVSSDQMPKEWHCPNDAPFNELNPTVYFNNMINDASSFIPILKTAKVIDFLQGPRMVLSNNDCTDGRPSVIKIFDNKYITIFSGKIDHSIWVADDIKLVLRDKFAL